MTPICIKEDASLLKNYSPASVLPTVSKTYEKIMQKQVLEYIDKHLSPHICGYRKENRTNTALISIPEKWRLFLEGYAGGVLIDLSKVFGTINHALLFAKLHAY